MYTVKLVTIATWRSVVKSFSKSTTATKQVLSTSWWRVAETWPLWMRKNKGLIRKHTEYAFYALLGLFSNTSHTVVSNDIACYRPAFWILYGKYIFIMFLSVRIFWGNKLSTYLLVFSAKGQKQELIGRLNWFLTPRSKAEL